MVGGVILAFLLLALNYIWVMLLVRRRGKQLERNSVVLHQHERALETARQMSVLGEMTSGFAHELNQPLSTSTHQQHDPNIIEREQQERQNHAADH
ncbi:hypothetical protein ACH54_11020 [Salmonella enterica subsp. enterica serovar Infantis]|nr:hypothetical protein ACH54_11020 [Salmonella enterica subsp. enterica serovar Infantis]